MTRKPDLQSPESILARIRNQKRPTEDIDMLARNLPTELLEPALVDIMAVDAGDRVVFDPTRMTSEEIREEGLYPCRRFSIPYTFGTKHQGTLKLDLSFGDPVSPEPRWIPLSARFPGHKGGELLGYPVEALLAEKIQTMLVRGLLSTRAKDIFDVWTQARINPGLRPGPVVESLRIVAAYRQTDLRMNTIVLTDEFAESPIQTEGAGDRVLDPGGHCQVPGQPDRPQARGGADPGPGGGVACLRGSLCPGASAPGRVAPGVAGGCAGP